MKNRVILSAVIVGALTGASAQADWSLWPKPAPTSSAERPFTPPEPLPTPTESPYPDPLPWPSFTPAPARPQADEWDKQNNPTLFSRRYEYNFNNLPLSGTLEDTAAMPWSDSFWPLNRGGIAYRWNAANPQNYKYAAPNRQQAKAMTLEQLSALSPAEKYDLYLGHYDYPMVTRAWGKGNEKSKPWEGICQGWTAAALLHPEPAEVTLANPDGILVPFGSSDVKALLSFFYAYDAPKNGRQIGTRCNVELRKNPAAINSGNCADLNPGSMHIVLANQLGMFKEGFAAEIDPGVEVWNQPVYAFESTILEESTRIPVNAARGTARRVLIETVMHYTDESDPRMYPVIGTDEYGNDSKTYRYWLDLSATGQILGGEWETFERPDFFWMPGKTSFSGDLKHLGEIYRPNRL